MNQKALGVLTIGQSPRSDVIPTMAPILRGVSLLQAGALDDLSADQVSRLAPRPGDHVLVTRLRTGCEVLLGKEQILGLLQERLTKFEAQGTEVVLLLCTGGFPRFDYSGLLLEPQKILHAAVRAIAGERKVGVLVPSCDQVQQLRDAWRASGLAVLADYASPYARREELNPAVDRLVASGAEFIVMDCMGYRPELKAAVQERAQCPVMLANTTVARITAELFN